MRYKCIMSHLTLMEASQEEQQVRQPSRPPSPKKKKKTWQQSSAQKAVTIDRRGGKKCDRNNPFFKHWKRHNFCIWLFRQWNNKISSLGGAQAYFHEAMIDHCWCPWIVMYWKTVLWIVTEIHSMKRELPKSSILYTSYIKDEYWRY